MVKIFITFLFYFFVIATSLCQNSLTQNGFQKEFSEAFRLFESEKYAAAKRAFDHILENGPELYRSDAVYYAAVCAVRRGLAQGEALLESFVIHFPEHPKSSYAFKELGDFYFAQGDYNSAIKYYQKGRFSQLSLDEQRAITFNLGYAYFAGRKFEEALGQFGKIKKGNHELSSAANYYSGYINLENDKYEEAITDLERAAESKSYKQAVNALLLKAYYLNRDYQSIIERESSIYNPGTEVAFYLAEANFAEKNFDKAAEWYGFAAEKGSKESRTAQFAFRAGIAHVKTQQHGKALDFFEQAALSNDTLASYASFELGKIHLRNENFAFARNAFNQAANENSPAFIAEESLFLLGKIDYQSENYANAINHFVDYTKRFPKGRFTEEVNNLLSDSYLNTNNYAQAIEYIEMLDDRPRRVDEVYQKVTFYRGVQLFNDGEFRPAVEHFNKSISYSFDDFLTAQAYFWMGEAYSIGKRYVQAREAYLSTLRVPGVPHDLKIKTYYGLGYAYYNEKQYQEALLYFKNYFDVARTDKDKWNYYDALIRLADVYYANKSYSNAITFYDLAIEEQHPEIDYAYYQSGLVSGIAGKDNQAIKRLNEVINRYPESRYFERAIFQKAQLLFEAGEYTASEKVYSQLINTSRDANLLGYAYLRRGLSYTNLNDLNKAAKDYETIITEYPNHEVANSALLGLQEVLTKSGKSDELDQYLTLYKQANPGDESVANIEFENAKALYFNQKYAKAIEALKEFISTYPNNINVFEADYYIAEAYYRIGNPTEALKYYQKVIEENKTSRVNRSLLRMAMIYSEENQPSLAISFFLQLATQAKNKRDLYFAYSGLMKENYKLEKYDSALYYAKAVLTEANVNVNAENESYLVQGKVKYEKGKLNEALDDFLLVLNSAKDESGAEAQYYVAKIYFDQKEYKQSIEALYDLNANFSAYEYWLGRSFLLIAANFQRLGEYFQARQTLLSLIENSPLEEIVNQASEDLRALDEQEQKSLKPTVDSTELTIDTLDVNKQ